MEIPQTITLWHGSPFENLGSILVHGLTLSERDLEGQLREVDLSQEPEYRKKRARDRLLETSKRHNGCIHVSGSKGYARRNGLGSKEYLGMLKGSYKEFYDNAKVVLFKIVLDWGTFESLIDGEYSHRIVTRFKELCAKGHWEKPSIKPFIEKYHDGNIFDGYHEFHLRFVPRSALVSYEVYVRKSNRTTLFDDFVKIGGMMLEA